MFVQKQKCRASTLVIAKTTYACSCGDALRNGFRFEERLSVQDVVKTLANIKYCKENLLTKFTYLR